MIKDLNRNEVKAGEVFHFQHSLEPFIYVDYSDPDCDYGMMFLNINSNYLYSFEDLAILGGLEFYRKDDDDDFLGVEVDGKIDWVDG